MLQNIIILQNLLLAQAADSSSVAATPAVTAPAAVPPVQHGVLHDAIANAGPVGDFILLLLLAASVASWAIIAYKLYYLKKAKAESNKFLDIFWGSKRLDVIYRETENLVYSPLAVLFRAGYQELAKIQKRRSPQNTDEQREDVQISDKDILQRTLAKTSLNEITNLESKISFLGTVASTGPFIGLFGTVWGIMDAFFNIGRMGNANLATIAPGVSEALLTTAVGLIAAVPAVVAYNYLNNRVKYFDVEMDSFSTDFLNIVDRHFFHN